MASRRSAQAEAIDHLRNGIRLAKQLPDARRRSQAELELLVALGAPLIESTGQGSHEVAETYARARDLCREIDDAPELFPTLWGLARHYQILGQVDVVLELNEQLLDLAKRSGDETQLLLARLSLGLTCFWTGNFARAVHHLDRTLELYDASRHASLAAEYGQDAEVSALAVSATALWLLGRPEQSRDRAERAVRSGRDCGHPLSHAFALLFASVIIRALGDLDRVQTLASAGLELAEEKELPVWVDLSRMMLGWARCADDPEAIVMIQRALESLSALGTGLTTQYQLTVLGDALAINGRHQEALGCFADALEVSSQSTFWNAETRRLYGEALLAAQPDAASDAEWCFRDALEFARDQEALGLELRAAMSLARLLAARGEKAEARRQLAAVYDRFDEGEGTPDLRAACALLNELGTQPDPASPDRT
jgi:tetratricopeptide (TPR) repeat protein